MTVNLKTIGEILGKDTTNGHTNTSLVDASSTGNIHTRTKPDTGYRRLNPYDTSIIADDAANHSLLEFNGYTAIAHASCPVGSNLDVTSVGPMNCTVSWTPAPGDKPVGTPPCTGNRVKYKVTTSDDNPFNAGSGTATVAYSGTGYDHAGDATSFNIQFAGSSQGEVVIGVHHVFIDADTNGGPPGTVVHNTNPAVGHICKGTLTTHVPAISCNTNGDGIKVQVMPLVPAITSVLQKTDSGGGTNVHPECTNGPECGIDTAYLQVIPADSGFTGKGIDVGWATNTSGQPDNILYNVSHAGQTFSIGTLSNSSTTHYVWVRWNGAGSSAWSNYTPINPCCDSGLN